MIALLLLLGCGPRCDASCPLADPVPPGVHAIESTDREDIVEGSVTIGDETVTIDYVDRDGRTIRVRYSRID